MDNNLYFKAYQQIQNTNNILLVTHDQPDGDAIASVCALAEFLDSLAKNFTIFCANLPPCHFNFLPQIEKFTNQLDSFTFDLIITVDCGSLARTKLTDEITNRKTNQLVIEFDHHPRVEAYSNLEIRNPLAASTTEIIYDFFKANKIRITKKLATCILTGIVTDTFSFFYPATSSATVKIASDMLSLGARLPQITENTWHNKSLKTMKIWGKALSNLQINQKYNIAITVLSSNDIPPDVNDDDLDGIAGFLSSLYDVNGILMLRQSKDGKIKGSLRTARSKMDISKLATLLGGGGHAKASGFTLAGQLEKKENGWKIN